MNDLGTMLRRSYRYTWLVLGSVFLLVCHRWLGNGQALNIGLPLDHGF